MSLAALLPPMPELLVEQIIIGDDAVTIAARLSAEAQPCPACGKHASQVHSYARRTLLDLPACGRPVRLSLQVRRFRCAELTCSRVTFTEQIPTLAAARARQLSVTLSPRQRKEAECWNVAHPNYYTISLSERIHVRYQGTLASPAGVGSSLKDVPGEKRQIDQYPRWLIPGPGKPWRALKLVLVAPHERTVHTRRPPGRYRIVP